MSGMSGDDVFRRRAAIVEVGRRRVIFSKNRIVEYPALADEALYYSTTYPNSRDLGTAE